MPFGRQRTGLEGACVDEERVHRFVEAYWNLPEDERQRIYTDIVMESARRRDELVATLACTIDGCDRRQSSKGYCEEHFWNWTKYGDPLGAPNEKRGKVIEFPRRDE